MSVLVTRPRAQYPADALARVSASGADAGNLMACAWLAQLAYETDDAKVEAIAGDWGLARTAFLQPASGTPLWGAQTFGHIFEGHGRTIVVFAGTDPLRFGNWISDVRALPGPDDIHAGFLAALDAAWPDVEAALRRPGRPEGLWIVGHSLGAALAVVCALRAHEALRVTADAVYGLGLPRVGGEAFMARYEAALGPRTIRLVHGRDLWAAVPPMALGYRHVGRRLSCASFARFDPSALAGQRDDEPRFPQGLTDTAAAVLRSLTAGPFSRTVRDDPVGLASALLPPALSDHLPDRYCRAATPEPGA